MENHEELMRKMEKEMGQLRETLRHSERQRDELEYKLQSLHSHQLDPDDASQAHAAPEPAQGRQTAHRMLREQDYEAWVRDRVSRGLFAKISTIGIAGLIVLGGVAKYFIDEVTKSKSLEVEQRLTRIIDPTQIEEDIIGKVSKQLDGSIAQKILNTAGVEEKLKTKVNELTSPRRINELAENALKEYAKDQMPPQIDSLVKAAVGKEETMDQLVEATAGLISSGGSIQQVLAQELSASYKDALDDKERLQTLRLLDVFDRGQHLRAIQTDILKRKETRGTELRRVALQSFRALAPHKDREILQMALGEMTQENEMDDKTREAYTTFFASQSDEEIPQLYTWVIDGSATDPKEIVVTGLARMERDRALAALVELSSEPDQSLAKLGWSGLSQLDPMANEFSTEHRRAALIHSWNELKERGEFALEFRGSGLTVSGKDRLKDHIQRLFRAFQNEDTSQIAQLQDEAESFDIDGLDWTYRRMLESKSFRRDFRERFSDAEELLAWIREGQDEVTRSQRATRKERTPGEWSYRAVAFVNLVRSSDWKDLIVGGKEPLWPEEAGQKQRDIVEASLSALMAKRIQIEHRHKNSQSFADDLIERVRTSPSYLVTDWFDEPITYALSIASGDTVESVLEDFESFLTQSHNVGDIGVLKSTNLLAASLKRATNPDFKYPYKQATKFLVATLDRLQETDPGHKNLTNILIQTLQASITEAGFRGQIPHRLVRYCRQRIESKSLYEQRFGVAALDLLTHSSGEHSAKITRALEDENIVIAVQDIRTRLASDAEVSGRVHALEEKLSRRLGWIGKIDTYSPQRIEPESPLHIDAESHQAGAVWFKFLAKNDAAYLINIKGGNSEIMVVATDQRQTLSRIQARDDQRTRLENLGDGDHYIRLDKREGKSTDPWQLTLHKIRRLEWASDPKLAQRLTAGAVYDGDFSDREFHWARISTKAGTKYVFATGSEFESSLDTVIEVYREPQGKRVAVDDDSGHNMHARLEWLSLVSDDHWVKVRLLDTGSKTEAPFEFSVMAEPLIDVSFSVQASANVELAPDIPTDGRVGEIKLPEDTDGGIVKISVMPDTAYAVQSSGELPLDSLGGAFVAQKLRDSSSEVMRHQWLMIAENDTASLHLSGGDHDAPTNLLLSVHPAATGRIVLSESLKSTPAIDFPFPSTGYLGKLGKGDWFARLEAKPDEYVISTVASPSLHIEVALLAQEGGNGKLSPVGTWGTESGEQAVRWLCEQEGTYFLRLSVVKGEGIIFLSSKALGSPRKEGDLDYDGFKVGDRVILGKHEELDPGGDNWNSEMDQYIGKETTIVELGHREGLSDLPVVKVDIDEGEWFWRTRNMQLPLRTIGLSQEQPSTSVMP